MYSWSCSELRGRSWAFPPASALPCSPAVKVGQGLTPQEEALSLALGPPPAGAVAGLDGRGGEVLGGYKQPGHGGNELSAWLSLAAGHRQQALCSLLPAPVQPCTPPRWLPCPLPGAPSLWPCSWPCMKVSHPASPAAAAPGLFSSVSPGDCGALQASWGTQGGSPAQQHSRGSASTEVLWHGAGTGRPLRLPRLVRRS